MNVKNRFDGRLKPKSETASLAATNKRREHPEEKVLEPSQIDDAPPNKIGRPISGKAKSSDPNYTQATLYLPRNVYDELKIAAIREKKDISDLATDIFTDFVEGRRK